ncbi:MAG: serine/threonine-protein kinase [Thermoguttaceae bacterium]|jgi:serine/threonine-protein kinase|nr:serine/threonine-protein kinase [Thermoguttaceae bacterium]
MNDFPDDPQAVELLDNYLSQLHAGKRPDRGAVLGARPDLGSALDCLDALEGMAPDDEAPEPTEDGATAVPPSGLGGLPAEFGQYELIEEIGRGGMGVVYKARQKGLDRLVAVKMILAGQLAAPEHVRRFHSEAKTAAQLQHAGIVHVHDVGQVHGQHFFAMEYVEGESLAQQIARGPVGFDRAVRLIIAVARAVDHLHRHGILHRDLKPSNILIDADGQPRVTDFGLAKALADDSQRTASGVIAGTPSYMSPEQASGRHAELGPETDVYSLGAVLYELLTGQPPFREENPLDTVMQVLSRDPPLPRQLNARVPRALELICLKCLSKSPEDRYRSAGELADDLERLARGEPLVARPPGPVARLQRWARREPALASRLGGLGLFGLIEMINYHTGMVPWDFHWKMSALIIAWAAGSVVCQRMLGSRGWVAVPARFVWGTLDSVLLLAVLLLANGATSPLVLGYPLIIAASGLWFRVRFVWLMTVLSLASYGVLVIDFYLWRPELHEGVHAGIDRHIAFAVSLFLLGSIVSYLVHRVRVLSAFCGRPVP